MFEIFDDGMAPYDGMDNAEVMRKVQSGYRLPAPAGCLADVYTTMQSCWLEAPSARPTFDALLAEISAVVAPAEPDPNGPSTRNAFNPRDRTTSGASDAGGRHLLSSASEYSGYTASNPLYKPSSSDVTIVLGQNVAGNQDGYVEVRSESDYETGAENSDNWYKIRQEDIENNIPVMYWPYSATIHELTKGSIYGLSFEYKMVAFKCSSLRIYISEARNSFKVKIGFLAN